MAIPTGMLNNCKICCKRCRGRHHIYLEPINDDDTYDDKEEDGYLGTATHI